MQIIHTHTQIHASTRAHEHTSFRRTIIQNAHSAQIPERILQLLPSRARDLHMFYSEMSVAIRARSLRIARKSRTRAHKAEYVYECVCMCGSSSHLVINVPIINIMINIIIITIAHH